MKDFSFQSLLSSTSQESDGSLKELLNLHYHNQSQALDFTKGVTSEQEQCIYTSPQRDGTKFEFLALALWACIPEIGHR